MSGPVLITVFRALGTTPDPRTSYRSSAQLSDSIDRSPAQAGRLPENPLARPPTGVRLRRACSRPGEEKAFNFTKRRSPHTAPNLWWSRHSPRRSSLGHLGTSRPDLSDLVPIRNSAENYVVLNWSALLLGHAHSLDARSLLSAGAPVLALGYMFEKDRALREGESVRDFVLLPEADHILHPAHRFGDQMIAVHVAPGSPVRFSSRALVWVWGSFRASAGDPLGSMPLYALERARVETADTGDIQKYFKLP